MTELKNMLSRVSEVSLKYGLKINISKTKWTVIHKKKDATLLQAKRLYLDNKEVDRENRFQNLGTWFTDDTD